MFFSKWFNKNKVDGCENMAESDQTLSDIVRGMQYCVNSSAEMIERQYMDRIDRYFDENGAPLTYTCLLYTSYQAVVYGPALPLEGDQKRADYGRHLHGDVYVEEVTREEEEQDQALQDREEERVQTVGPALFVTVDEHTEEKEGDEQQKDRRCQVAVQGHVQELVGSGARHDHLDVYKRQAVYSSSSSTVCSRPELHVNIWSSIFTPTLMHIFQPSRFTKRAVNSSQPAQKIILFTMNHIASLR